MPVSEPPRSRWERGPAGSFAGLAGSSCPGNWFCQHCGRVICLGRRRRRRRRKQSGQAYLVESRRQDNVCLLDWSIWSRRLFCGKVQRLGEREMQKDEKIWLTAALPLAVEDGDLFRASIELRSKEYCCWLSTVTLAFSMVTPLSSSRCLRFFTCPCSIAAAAGGERKWEEVSPECQSGRRCEGGPLVQFSSAWRLRSERSAAVFSSRALTFSRSLTRSSLSRSRRRRSSLACSWSVLTLSLSCLPYRCSLWVTEGQSDRYKNKINKKK